MKKIIFIEVKSEIGAGTRGASLGVEAIKIASLDFNSDLFKNHPSIEVDHINELLFDGAQHASAKFIDGVLIMEERMCLCVYEQLFDLKFPVILSGDHSTAYGTISGIKKKFPDKRLGVVWIDAHADLHSPYTTPSGNMHGMSLAMACNLDNLDARINNLHHETISYWEQIKNVGISGAKVLPQDIVLIGLRDLEKPEHLIIEKEGVQVIEVAEVKNFGAAQVAQQALDKLKDCDLIYVSFDVDVVDSKYSTGTGTPVPNGLTFEQCLDLNVALVKSPKVCAWEITEVNPTLDSENLMAENAFNILQHTVQSILTRS